jgi:hypothetical protein
MIKEEKDIDIVGTIKTAIPITKNDVENVIVTAFEGGINYWAGLKNKSLLWKTKPDREPLSLWATKLLLDGKSVLLYDIENPNTNFELTIKGLLKGIEQYYVATDYQIDKENWDAESADCIVQYALFGEIVYC